jgi:hypothetical protein
VQEFDGNLLGVQFMALTRLIYFSENKLGLVGSAGRIAELQAVAVDRVPAIAPSLMLDQKTVTTRLDARLRAHYRSSNSNRS